MDKKDETNLNLILKDKKKKSDNKTDNKPAKWTKDHEKILIDWADKAMCYRWLHSKSNHKLSKINTYFTIPVIIMSTITGTANFAAERVPLQYRGYYSMIIGGVNIIAGIVTTIQQFLKIGELNEAHRVSAISWDKFYRKIRVELAKPPYERQNIYDFLKSCTEEFDRLMETSPVIEKQIIELFNRTFNGPHIDKKKKEMFESLKKPEICDSLESVQYAMYKEDENTKKENKFKSLLDDYITNSSKLSEDQEKQMKNQIIDDFVENFIAEMLRSPTKQELMNNLNISQLGIGEYEINLYINQNPRKFKRRNTVTSEIHDLGELELGNDPASFSLSNVIENDAPLKKL